MLHYTEFSAKIKAKYPEYQDKNDFDLAKAIIAKYPEYQSQVSFNNRPGQGPIEEGIEPLSPSGYIADVGKFAKLGLEKLAEKSAELGKLGGLVGVPALMASEVTPTTEEEVNAQAILGLGGKVLPTLAEGAYAATPQAIKDLGPELGRIVAGSKFGNAVKTAMKYPSMLKEGIGSKFSDIKNSYNDFLKKLGVVGGSEAVKQFGEQRGLYSGEKIASELGPNFEQEMLEKVKNYDYNFDKLSRLGQQHKDALRLSARYRDQANALEMQYHSTQDPKFLNQATDAFQEAAKQDNIINTLEEAQKDLKDKFPNIQDIIIARQDLSGRMKLPPTPDKPSLGKKVGAINNENLNLFDDFLDKHLQLSEEMAPETPYGKITSWRKANEVFEKGKAYSAMGDILPKTDTNKSSITRGMLSAGAAYSGGPVAGITSMAAQSPLVYRTLLQAGMYTPEMLKVGAALAPSSMRQPNESTTQDFNY